MSAFNKDDPTQFLRSIDLDEDTFLPLLEKLIGESKFLQNNPAQGLIPEEERAADHVLKVLEPFLSTNGGIIEAEKLCFKPNRANLILKYPGTDTTTEECVSFVGSHMDVVPADPETWEFDPFTLTREGDELLGRGTTDCLGHVGLLTTLLYTLAKNNVQLAKPLYVIFIANEENSLIEGVGIDQLGKIGKLDPIKGGPVFWVDSADSHPCLGTAGSLQWRLTAHGRMFHSGLPFHAINPIEFLSESVNVIQRMFYQDFPKHEQEDRYNFTCSSTMKPTQLECAKGSVNQIPAHATAIGDVRLVPFYDVKDVQKKVSQYVEDINNNPDALPTRGPFSKYTIPAKDADGNVVKDGATGEVEYAYRARLELEWLVEGENGIACNMDSVGNRALLDATKRVLQVVKPFSISGTLPLVRELQDDGFDIQISGYGSSAKYHADNESASLSDFRNAMKIFGNILSILNYE